GAGRSARSAAAGSVRSVSSGVASSVSAGSSAVASSVSSASSVKALASSATLASSAVASSARSASAASSASSVSSVKGSVTSARSGSEAGKTLGFSEGTTGCKLDQAVDRNPRAARCFRQRAVFVPQQEADATSPGRSQKYASSRRITTGFTLPSLRGTNHRGLLSSCPRHDVPQTGVAQRFLGGHSAWEHACPGSRNYRETNHPNH